MLGKKIFLILLLLPFGAFAIDVKFDDFARVKIYYTKFRGEADLYVYITSFLSPDDEGRWRIVSIGEDISVKATKFRGEADIIVYLTQFAGEAGWQKGDHFLKGHLKTNSYP